MLSAKKYIVLHQLLTNKLQASFPDIINSLSKTKFKYTGKALISFVVKSGYLTNSILLSCDCKGPYSAAILFRSLIEHAFKHLYIYTKALNENSDSVGEDYYHSLKGNEDLESITKINNYSSVVYPEKTKWHTKGDHNKKIKETAKQFDISQIFYYLIKNNNTEGKEEIKKYKKEYLLSRLVEYTNMSSSVHGGPFGELALNGILKNKTKYRKTISRFVMDSCLLYKNIIEATYLFAYLMDDTLKSYYEDISSVYK